MNDNLIVSRSVLEQALEALEGARVLKADHQTLETYGTAQKKHDRTITTLRTALATAESESIFHTEFIAKQEPLPPEFRLTEQERWDLYEGDDAPVPASDKDAKLEAKALCADLASIQSAYVEQTKACRSLSGKVVPEIREKLVASQAQAEMLQQALELLWNSEGAPDTDDLVVIDAARELTPDYTALTIARNRAWKDGMLTAAEIADRELEGFSNNATRAAVRRAIRLAVETTSKTK